MTMEPSQRMQIITERLQKHFSPQQLEVIDDSHKHIGHAGSRGGAGHYTIIIKAESLQGMSRVATHREIYKVLNDLIPHEIHALVIKTFP